MSEKFDYNSIDPSEINPDDLLSKDPNERRSDDDDIPDFEEDDEKRDEGF